MHRRLIRVSSPLPPRLCSSPTWSWRAWSYFTPAQQAEKVTPSRNQHPQLLGCVLHVKPENNHSAEGGRLRKTKFFLLTCTVQRSGWIFKHISGALVFYSVPKTDIKWTRSATNTEGSFHLCGQSCLFSRKLRSLCWRLRQSVLLISKMKTARG